MKQTFLCALSLFFITLVTATHSEEKPQDFGAVLKALNSDNAAERAKAVEALKNDKLVDDFLAPLGKAMQSNDEMVRVYAERTFAHLINSVNAQATVRASQDSAFLSRIDSIRKLKRKDWAATRDATSDTQGGEPKSVEKNLPEYMTRNPKQPAADTTKLTPNEEMAVATCRLYAQAQDEYRRTDWDKDEKLEYAQTLKELVREGMPVQLLKSLADAEGPKGTPKAGYLFKVLKKQGKFGPGGEREYMSGENMSVGYALLAWPAQYGVTGKYSFQISSSGTVYRLDFGKDTAALIEKIDAFFSTNDWQVVE